MQRACGTTGVMKLSGEEWAVVGVSEWPYGRLLSSQAFFSWLAWHFEMGRHCEGVSQSN